ncbi:Hypothetical protein MexAM1_META2p0300 (plasmid) [Methylorubrum extorquens AM1]|uniref:Uncharacterized protein n=1 Tax=Methylorubrum extorquens (strain ATCC 14718 / DSM 1338 / JCM 2805 / NCIMB 9133 / AM1) TaxID=272630 RepID=C5B3Z3_METEA|nr:Hypothetical protein MexAM1_META2p0300 [Methylorubrum extorquens AM1]
MIASNHMPQSTCSIAWERRVAYSSPWNADLESLLMIYPWSVVSPWTCCVSNIGGSRDAHM